MGKITNLQLLDIFEKAVRENWGYVWGKNGSMYSKEEAERLVRVGASVPDGRSKSTYFTVDCAKWFGKMVADCSGSIVYAIRQFDPSFSDHGSWQFREKFTECGPISEIPEIPGLGLYRPGHIGIYAGNGIMYEFRGTTYGAVATKLKDRGMTLWGKLHCVDYVQQNAPMFPRQMTVVTITEPLKLRNTPSDGAIVGKMPKGAQVWAVNSVEVDGSEWFELVYFNGSHYLQGWASGKYLK